MFSPSSTVLPHVKTGRLRALAVTTAARLPSLPELPTVAESGLKGYETITWFGFVAPARTPPAVITRLNAEIVKVLALPEVRNLFASQGIETLGGTPDRFASYIRDEIAKWAEAIRLSGAKAE
jgi:tripartite-type tricarboxylate transporter receptor subunit TctC